MVVELKVVEFSVCYIHDAMCKLKCCVTTYVHTPYTQFTSKCMHVCRYCVAPERLQYMLCRTCKMQCVDHVQTM